MLTVRIVLLFVSVMVSVTEGEDVLPEEDMVAEKKNFVFLNEILGFMDQSSDTI